MSLINQMLKELDARRSDAAGANPFGEQVRAVPAHRRVHPAWWVALALGLSLVTVVVWALLRPPAPEPYAVHAQLPLKLEVDLGAIASPDVRTAVPAAAASGEPVMPEAVQADVPLAAVTTNPAARDVPAPVFSVAGSPVSAEPAPLTGKAAVSASPSPIAPPSREMRPKVAVPIAAPAAVASEPDGRQADPLAKQVRELTPQQRAENEFRKATLLIQQGQRADARIGLEQVLRLDPKHVAARQTLIGVLLDAMRRDEALNHAREGLELDRRQVGLAMILARLQVEKNELRAAIDTLERTRPYASERADYLAFLAALLQRDEQHRQAAELYLLALQKTPENGVWWMGLGISLQADARSAEAGEAYRRAKASNSLAPDLLAFIDARLAQIK